MVISVIITMTHYTSSNIKFYQEKKVQLLILSTSNAQLTTSSPDSKQNENTDFSHKSEVCPLVGNNC